MKQYVASWRMRYPHASVQWTIDAVSMSSHSGYTYAAMKRAAAAAVAAIANAPVAERWLAGDAAWSVSTLLQSTAALPLLLGRVLRSMQPAPAPVYVYTAALLLQLALDVDAYSVHRDDWELVSQTSLK